MTDKEKLIALLTEFGVGMEVEPGLVVCEYGMIKVVGYIGFATMFEFDADGKFKQMGAWE